MRTKNFLFCYDSLTCFIYCYLLFVQRPAPSLTTVTLHFATILFYSSAVSCHLVLFHIPASNIFNLFQLLFHFPILLASIFHGLDFCDISTLHRPTTHVTCSPIVSRRTENFIVAWKRGIAILSAGSVKVTPDPRVRLLTKNGGFSLQIKDAQPQDAGDYICQIATLEPMEIIHTVEILGK